MATLHPFPLPVIGALRTLIRSWSSNYFFHPPHFGWYVKKFSDTWKYLLVPWKIILSSFRWHHQFKCAVSQIIPFANLLFFFAMSAFTLFPNTHKWHFLWNDFFRCKLSPMGIKSHVLQNSFYRGKRMRGKLHWAETIWINSGLIFYSHWMSPQIIQNNEKLVFKRYDPCLDSIYDGYDRILWKFVPWLIIYLGIW